MTKKILFATICALLSFVLVLSCRRDSCHSMYCMNGGVCNNGVCLCPTGYAGPHCDEVATSTILIKNDVFTPIDVTVDNQTTTIPVGGTASFTGTAGSTITGQATTSGTTSQGDVLGETIGWSLNNYYFPNGGGTTVIPIDLGPDFFFLYIQNNSTVAVKSLAVNYGTTAERDENISIPADGYTYSIGYFESYTNSNVRVTMTDNSTATWSSLTLNSYDNNQSFTATIQ